MAGPLSPQAARHRQPSSRRRNGTTVGDTSATPVLAAGAHGPVTTRSKTRYGALCPLSPATRSGKVIQKLYDQHVAPHLVHSVCSRAPFPRQRELVVPYARGEVLPFPAAREA